MELMKDKIKCESSRLEAMENEFKAFKDVISKRWSTKSKQQVKTLQKYRPYVRSLIYQLLSWKYPQRNSPLQNPNVLDRKSGERKSESSQKIERRRWKNPVDFSRK
jgi:hypothetical protein